MTAGRVGLAVLAAGVVLAPAALAAPPPPSPAPPPPGRILDALLAPRGGDVVGTEYREFTTTAAAGRVRGHLIRVDLANRRVAMRLLRPAVVSAVGTVPDLAARAGAIGGVNGNFFDEGGTGASVGVEYENEALVKSAVPLGRRPAPPGPPGSSPDTVIGIDTQGVGRIGRVLFSGSVRFGGRELPLAGLNLYAVPVGGIAAFTPAWGGTTRARTVCGSDTDVKAPCAGEAVEVRVRAGKAVAVGAVGTTAVPADEVALVARDAAAASLRALRPGDPVDSRWTAVAPDTPPLRTALGALALVRDGAPWPGLQTTERAPRTAVGLSGDGRTLWLIAVDGRQEASVGATLAELGRLVTDLGIPQAVALDGGGSTQMVRRPVGGPLAVVNVPSAKPLRAVADGLAVVPAG
ncbi:phosphodiester glycosidase family protein [Actinomycetospora chiangmaiensis]|uniref:phosphodiester glycosidase family protein n=1 Tax=Actinomycetospora chiangmaiensis TaxID=402650 RepID=UPI00039A96EE|nr:phosphodiester glycosidase family protein [Actinomycetospora chiangmaiensis]